jgi:predicted membrane channel-forming protein YqfA (hemolysin III family)
VAAQVRDNTKASQARDPAREYNTSEDTMNSIIYIVGLVVIIGVILSYFGFR